MRMRDAGSELLCGGTTGTRAALPSSARWIGAIAALLACALPLAGPPAASGATGGRLSIHKPALTRSGSARGARWACPRGACDAVVVAPTKVAGDAARAGGDAVPAGSGERRGLDPADLQSAYKIPSTIESPQTIALIDAYGYPDAESDLATYRERYGLPACTKANGCFKKVNEKGKETDLPMESEEWDVEAALDEDMASAACPQCHLLLVEGSGELPSELGAAVNMAAKLGATEISNSYGYPETLEEVCGKSECAQYEKDYKHTGILVLAAAGDAGYEDAYYGLGPTTDFPASSPSVLAVGGTELFKAPDTARGWSEEVWNEPFADIGTSGGCTSRPKPVWQSDTGCTKRTDNDVAAVAALVTPVSVRLDGSWTLVGGTSVATPLIAGIEAHASAQSRSEGADAFYKAPGSLFDVTEGYSWNSLNETGMSECEAEEYLCNAEVGYDGPTGLGTPDGVPDLYETPVVKRISPSSGPLAGGTKVKISGSGLNGASEVEFGSEPAKALTVSSSTSITAESPAASSAGIVAVTVHTAGGTSAESHADEFTYKGKG